jgi:hypothetical protein
MGDHHRQAHRDRGSDLHRAVRRRGTRRPGPRRAALLAGAAAVLLGGWFTASAVIAGHGWYHTLPWFPVAVAGVLGTLLALSRIPVVARALAAPGMASRLVGPHSFRVAGVVFLCYLALGHLPALFACPQVWATLPPVSPRRWSRAGSPRAPAAAPPCGSTRSASPIWSRPWHLAPSPDSSCSTSRPPVPRSPNSRSR